jgi:hypothetical protein
MLAFIDLELAILQCFAEDLTGLWEFVHIYCVSISIWSKKSMASLRLTVQNDESLAHQAHNDDLEPVLHTSYLIPRGIVVGDGATAAHTAELSHTPEHQVENLTTDIIEIDIAISVRTGQCLLEVVFEAALLVYNQLLVRTMKAICIPLTVQTKVCSNAFNPLALLISTSHTDDLLATNDILRDLNSHHSSSPSSTRDNNDIIFRRINNVNESKVCSQACETQSTKVMGLAHTTRKVRSWLNSFGRQDSIFRPPRGT